MHRLLAQALDRLSLRLAAGSVQRGMPTGHVAEAQALIHGPEFFADFATAPPDWRWIARHRWQCSSPIITPWPDNNIVCGRFYPAATPWTDRPTVVFLHGWNAEWGSRALFPLLARRWNAAGLNALMFALPFHGPRKPRACGAPHNFLADDLLHVARAAHQALADARAVIAWLTAAGCRRIGLWGMSLGGWLAGLLACHEPRLQAVVLFTPLARLDRLINELDLCMPLRQRLASQPVRLDPLNLISHQPCLARTHILIIAALYDLFVPVDSVEELWQIWGEPVLWRAPHGHISALMAAPVLAEATRWLADRLGT